MDRVSIYTIIIILMIMTLPVISHLLREKPSILKFSNALFFGIYLFANLYLTIFSRLGIACNTLTIKPLWSYVEAINNHGLREQIILNIILYIPLGYLIHCAFPKIRWWQILLYGFGLSLMTEIVQYVFRLGWRDIDDLIRNTLGTIIGIGLYQLYLKLALDSAKRAANDKYL